MEEQKRKKKQLVVVKTTFNEILKQKGKMQNEKNEISSSSIFILEWASTKTKKKKVNEITHDENKIIQSTKWLNFCKEPNLVSYTSIYNNI